MNSNQMKNIIVLKNLPSNIVDEAFIILKNNKKIKSLERIEKQNTNLTEKQKTGEYIVKEAEMVIGNYLSRIEKEKQQKSYSVRQIETRYKKNEVNYNNPKCNSNSRCYIGNNINRQVYITNID